MMNDEYFLSVGEGLAHPDVYKNIIAICSGRRGRRPLQVLIGICYFDCRGDQWSSVIYKGIIAF